jgi:hypothetical protein
MTLRKSYVQECNEDTRGRLIEGMLIRDIPIYTADKSDLLGKEQPKSTQEV